MRAVLSALLEASSLPSGEKARPLIQSVCPLSSSGGALVSRFHTRMVESVPPVASHLPSAENATASISSLACSIGVIARLSRSSSATDPERPATPAATASWRLSLPNATARTWPDSPPSLRTSFPSAAFQRRTSLYPPETRILPSGENASAVTGTLDSAAERVRAAKTKRRTLPDGRGSDWRIAARVDAYRSRAQRAPREGAVCRWADKLSPLT